MNRLELIEAATEALAEADPYLNDWTPEATLVIDAILPLLGDDSAEFRVGRNAPDTSREMSEKVKRGTLQDEVLDLFMNLYRAGGVGATDDDIKVSLKRSHQSVSGARNTLVRKGYLIDSGYTRLNRYGNQAIRWEYTDKVVER